MSADKDSKKNSELAEVGEFPSLVVRSVVPAGLKYPEYRKYLRNDFYYSCAYCTIAEAEATAIRFTIDHYEPQGSRPDLVDDYSNLMYSCDECNQRKGNRNPPVVARADGYRFFRPDQDVYSDHLELSGVRVNPKSNVGYYSIEALDLNRLTLRRIREIRDKLTECDRYVAEGILSLRRVHIDRLPPHIKAQAAKSIREATKLAQDMGEQIDDLLRRYAESDLAGEDAEEHDRTKQRRKKLKHLEGIYPGEWRAKRAK